MASIRSGSGPRNLRSRSTQAAEGPCSQNPKIKFRYSTKQILQIFKGLGRFQSPLEHPALYSINMEKEGTVLRDLLMLTKPDVVLEHLKSENALPLISDVRIQSKLLTSVTSQLNQVNLNPSS